jgi:hypothetical protein
MQQIHTPASSPTNHLAGRRRVQQHAVDPDGPLDVLDRLFPEEGEAAPQLALEVVVRRPGDGDPARLGELLEARGDVHPVAVEIALFMGCCPSFAGSVLICRAGPARSARGGLTECPN